MDKQLPGKALTIPVDMRHNYHYHGGSLNATRSQSGSAPRPWRVAMTVDPSDHHGNDALPQLY